MTTGFFWDEKCFWHAGGAYALTLPLGEFVQPLAAGGLPLLLPRIARASGDTVRVRIAAHDVILARQRPEGLTAQNVIEGTIAAIRPGTGPGMIVSVDTRAGRILARVTRRGATATGLAEGGSCWVVIKAVAIAPEDISGPAPAGG